MSGSIHSSSSSDASSTEIERPLSLVDPTTPIHSREKVSFSELCCWDDCPHRWYIDYLLGPRIKTFGVDLFFGDSVHSALEQTLRRTGSVSPTAAAEYFESRFSGQMRENRLSLERPISDDDLNDLVHAGRRICERARDIFEIKEFVGGEVVFNELKLVEPIARADGRSYTFKGFVDIGMKVPKKRGKGSLLWVLDFKTCGWGWPWQRKADVSKHRQLFLYKHFLCRKHGLDPRDVRCGFVLLKKRPRPLTRGSLELESPFELVTVGAGPNPITRAVEHLSTRITGMCSGLHPKNRSSCKKVFGSFTSTCPHLGTERCPEID